MATKQRITAGLQATLEKHPEIGEVYFTADGHYHFRAFDCGGKRYTRLQQVPETSKGGITTGKFVKAALKNVRGEDDAKHLIVETASRADVMSATPVAETTNTLLQTDALDILNISPDEYVEFMASRKKKK